VNRSTKQYAPEPVDPGELLVKWDHLAFKFTAGWSIPGLDRDDLVQEARITIYRVAQSYDPAKGSFYAVARMSIGNRMKSLLAFSSVQKRTADIVHLHSPIGEDGMLVEDIIPSEASIDVAYMAEEKVRLEIADIVALPIKKQIPRIAALDIRVSEIAATFGVRIPPARKFNGISRPAGKLADSLRIRDVLRSNPLGVSIRAISKISGIDYQRVRYLVKRSTESYPKTLTNLERISHDHYRIRSDETPRLVNNWQFLRQELEKYPFGLTIARLHELTGLGKIAIDSALRVRCGTTFLHKEGLWFLPGQDISARFNLPISELLTLSDKILAAITRNPNGVTTREISRLTGFKPRKVSAWFYERLSDFPQIERCDAGFFRLKQQTPLPPRSITSRVLAFLSHQTAPVSVKTVADGINESFASVLIVLNKHRILPHVCRLPDGLFVHDPDKSAKPLHLQKVVDFLTSAGRPVVLSEIRASLGLSSTSVSPVLNYGLLYSLFSRRGKLWSLASQKICDKDQTDSNPVCH